MYLVLVKKKKMQLDSIHPGVSIEQAKENKEEEIELLEKQIDPDH